MSKSDKNNLNVLFITRKFPPTKGGMETMAFELSQALSAKENVKLLKWGGSNLALLLILPYFFIYSTVYLLIRKPDIIYLQDGVLSPLGWWFKLLSKKAKVCITLHGLDVTFDNFIYRNINLPSLKKLDLVIAVSDATKEQVLKIGIPDSKIKVIPNGINDAFYKGTDRPKYLEQLEREIKVDLQSKKILLSSGRLVKRKGIHWFVKNVFAKVVQKHPDSVYVISGSGDYDKQIDRAIKKTGLTDKVFMLGRTTDEIRNLLFNVADIFVMPNIKIEGDMEGFGITQLEAASSALTVVASDLEGIKDAIIRNENGFLIEPEDAESFVRTINRLLDDLPMTRKFGMKARKYTLANYAWSKIADNYISTFYKLSQSE